MTTLTLPQPLTLRMPTYQRVDLTLIGCGGTGSHMATGLGALALALREAGTPCEITLMDGDKVEAKNVGRQLFTTADLGQYKAHVLALRLRAAYGLPVGAETRMLATGDTLVPADPETLAVVIGAVDNHATRQLIAAQVTAADGKLWWLDCGNERHSGQVVLGNTTQISAFKQSVGLGLIDRVPAASVLYPEMLLREKRAPLPKQRATKAASCAELLATGEQGLTVNRMVSAWALTLLEEFLLRKSLNWFALAFGCAWGGTRPYTLDVPTLAAVTHLKPREITVGAVRRRD